MLDSQLFTFVTAAPVAAEADVQPVAAPTMKANEHCAPREARHEADHQNAARCAPSNDQCQRVGIVASKLAVADVDEGHRGNPALGPDGPQLLRGTDRQTRPDGLHFINPRSYRAASQRIIGTRSAALADGAFDPPNTRRGTINRRTPVGRLCHSTSIPVHCDSCAHLPARWMIAGTPC